MGSAVVCRRGHGCRGVCDVEVFQKEKGHGMKTTHTFILFSLLNVLLWLSGYAAEARKNKTGDTYVIGTPVYSRIVSLYSATQNYMVAGDGNLPDSLDKLTQPWGRDKEFPPLLQKEDIIDPWGEPYGYEIEDHYFVIFSSGPDKKRMTKDDLIRTYPSSYAESWKLKQIRILYGVEMNEVQKTKPLSQVKEYNEAVPPSAPVAVERRPLFPEPVEKPNPWKTPLLIDVVVSICVVSAWLCFRKKWKVRKKFSVLRTLLLFGIVLGVICSGFAPSIVNDFIISNRQYPSDPLLPTHNRLRAINTEMTTYRVAFGRLPDSLEVFIDDKYFVMSREDLADQWKTPLGYEHNGEDYIIWSSGPDKKTGTEDDIMSSSSPSYLERWKARHVQL